MDMRYIRYIHPSRKYYAPIRLNDTKIFTISDTSKEWWIEKDHHWTYCIHTCSTLPSQGWKIHISTVPNHAQSTLDVITPFLMEKNISFKFVSTLRELLYKNAKYADRASSGKFITIYPNDEEQFTFLLNELHHLLQDTPKGPYILSDKRWLDGNVYFRYGAFQEMFIWDGAAQVPAIKTPAGDYIPDHRKPSYHIPEFIREPKAIQDMSQKEEMEQKKESTHSKIDTYDLQSALHFSNGGGVYLAYHKSFKEYVVLKEGRPEAGLDGQKRDAISRLRHEAAILKRLNGLDSTVEYIDFFQEWEHYFLVEEYVSGSSLNSVMATSYPFSRKSSTETYRTKMISILHQLVKAVQDVHSRGIGIGDLQPANVIVTDTGDIKLIDFETAGDINDTEMAGLGTPGFMGASGLTKEQSDWFALISIARQVFVPTGPVRDLAGDIVTKHDKWIEAHFGKDVIQMIKDLEAECKKRSVEAEDHILSVPKRFFDNQDIPAIKANIREGIMLDLQDTENHLHGDIRQYETSGGLFNVLTGGFGVIMALNRTGPLPETSKYWALEYSDEAYTNQLGHGLFTGKAGVAGVLQEIGMEDKALDIYASIPTETSSEDISLRSGLAGIGLALLAASTMHHSHTFLEKSISIARKLEAFLRSDVTVNSSDYDAVPIGLMDGWSGASLFFGILSSHTNERHWLHMAMHALEKDINQCQFDQGDTFLVKDVYGRLLPYLAGGSAGIGLVMMELHHLLGYKKWEKELNGIRKAIVPRCTYNPGLFTGLAGLITVANTLDVADESQSDNDDMRDLLETMNLFILEEKGGYFVPGNYGFKVSGDVFSGSAGVLLTLHTIGTHGYSWLPIPNMETLLPSFTNKIII